MRAAPALVLSRLLALPLVLPLAWASSGPAAGGGSPEASPGSDPDPGSLLERARQVQEADVAAWVRFAFRRSVLREKLDDAGRVTWREEIESVVTPAAGGFHERLSLVDGRTPSHGQRDQHRRSAPFSRHYATMRSGAGGDRDPEGGYSLADLLRLSSYRMRGRERVEGVDCHRLDFAPEPGRSEGGLKGRFARVMAGTLWLTADGLHVMKATARSLEPVPIALGLAKVAGLQLEFDAVSVGGAVWLPRRIDVRTRGHVLGVGFRRHDRYVYSGFEPSGSGPPPSR